MLKLAIMLCLQVPTNYDIGDAVGGGAASDMVPMSTRQRVANITNQASNITNGGRFAFFCPDCISLEGRLSTVV